LDWSEVTPKIRAIRGVYATVDEAREALTRHLGLMTR
jgi:hypothetical protein